MHIRLLEVDGYRSIRSVRLRLQQINVLVGPNGCGKTNLYRSLYLLHAAAAGQLSRTLADEGGIPSVLWAGDRVKGPVRMKVGVETGELAYSLACGLSTPDVKNQYESGEWEDSKFNLDPEVKEERVEYGAVGKRVALLERKVSAVSARDAEGRRVTYPMAISPWESVLSQLREPHRFPQLSALRQELLDWRFYHQFRSDAESPLRQPQIGVRTPILSHDGRDLAAALQTIIEIGNEPALREAVDRAFPGSDLEVEVERSRFRVLLRMPEFHRPFEPQELSDGTLRYLCLVAALLSPRLPSLLALNEPETSLHPDLLPPLARLIVDASRESQMWITTHSQHLAAYIAEQSGVEPVQLEKVEGETRVAGQGMLDPYLD
jgi:predicted ATPase